MQSQFSQLTSLSTQRYFLEWFNFFWMPMWSRSTTAPAKKHLPILAPAPNRCHLHSKLPKNLLDPHKAFRDSHPLSQESPTSLEKSSSSNCYWFLMIALWDRNCSELWEVVNRWSGIFEKNISPTLPLWSLISPRGHPFPLGVHSGVIMTAGSNSPFGEFFERASAIRGSCQLLPAWCPVQRGAERWMLEISQK